MSRSLLDVLLETGKITIKDIEEADETILTDDRCGMIEHIHLCCCKRDHDSGECKWYLEVEREHNDGEDAYKLPSHKEWLNTILQLKKDFNLTWGDISNISCVVKHIESGSILAAISRLLSSNKII